jgi:hypothetical protein
MLQIKSKLVKKFVQGKLKQVSNMSKTPLAKYIFIESNRRQVSNYVNLLLYSQTQKFKGYLNLYKHIFC